MKNDEKENDSSIVVKVGLPNKPKFLIYGIYHQWSIPGGKESKVIKKQEVRWKETIEKNI